MAVDGTEEDYDSQGRDPFMVRHARVWYRASTIQLPVAHHEECHGTTGAAMQLYNALFQSKLAPLQ